jgi:6-pyruvoyltetrahydropterin/6-carboxytetrahydropterin synthase
MIRVTKEFKFEAAHALDGYNGKCKDIHGHSYHLKITVLGSPKSDANVSDCGMVIDFSDIKLIVKDEIMPLFDHILILRKDSRFKGIEKQNERVRYVPYQPTCENMLIEIIDIMKAYLPTTVTLKYGFLRETKTSYAEWFLEDN